MPAADPRYGVAQVTIESLDGWRDFCDRHNLDRNAFAEIIGLRLGELAAKNAHLPPVLDRWVREAKNLKNERRRRG